MVHIIGAGLAGCECANALSKYNIECTLYEMKPEKKTPAHKSDYFAELVCSNSLKADRLSSASGMLKAEMREFSSIVLESAEQTKVPAGGALAVDRDKFAKYITDKIKSLPNVDVVSKEVINLDNISSEDYVIIATGPLTSDKFSKYIQELCGAKTLSFYDAAAPIITKDSIDMDKCFFAARYDKGDPDYINCPFEKDEYEKFIAELQNAETVELKEFEKDSFRVYEGCMPVEVMAKRGADTLRFGPLKPVGLINPSNDKRPYAVVQLRKENVLGNLYNIVGFQTNLKFPEQKRVFSMIPGLENAEFMRFGVMHRNTFIDSPRVLNKYFSMRNNAKIYFAGQITGVEGYVESSACGILVGHNVARNIMGKEQLDLPKDTMLGGLSNYISDDFVTNFQPMGANMGILPELGYRIKNKQERYQKVAERGLESLRQYLSDKI